MTSSAPNLSTLISNEYVSSIKSWDDVLPDGLSLDPASVRDLLSAIESNVSQAVKRVRFRFPWLDFPSTDQAESFIFSSIEEQFTRLVKEEIERALARGVDIAQLSEKLAEVTTLRPYLASIFTPDHPLRQLVEKKWNDRNSVEYPRQLTLATTYHCNSSCSYCMVDDQSRLGSDLPFTSYLRILAWMKENKCTRLSFTGGEPTLHPDFEKMVQTALDQGLQVYFNSNGLWEKSLNLPWKDNKLLNIGIHVGDPSITSQPHQNWQERTLDFLATQAAPVFLRFNLLPAANPPLEYLLGLSSRYGIPYINYAFTFPNRLKTNAYYPINFPKAAFMLEKLAMYHQSSGVAAHLSKPFPVCRAHKKTFHQLRAVGLTLSSCDLCQNGFANNLICNPDGAIQPCIGLPITIGNIFDNPLYEDLGLRIRQRIQGILQLPLYQECKDCILFLQHRCQGVCLAYTYPFDAQGM